MTKRSRSHKSQLISHLLPIRKQKLLLHSGTVTKDDVCPDCGFIYPFILRPNGEREYIAGAFPICTEKSGQQGHVTQRLLRLLTVGEYKVKAMTVGVKTVIFEGPDGQISVPARSDEPTPKGYNRLELQSLAEVDRFNRKLQMQEKANYDLYHERENQLWNEHYRQLGREMRAGGRMTMPDGSIVDMPPWEEMSEFGREMAREAERENGQYKGYDRNYIPPAFIAAAYYDEGSLRHRGRE